jgi:hypothetical protein
VARAAPPVDDDATSVYTCQGTCNYDIVFGITPGG